MEQKLITKQQSRKKFLKILAGGMLAVPLLAPLTSADLFLRREDSSTINFNDIKEVTISTSTKTETSDYNILSTDDTIFVDGTSNEVTLTLPTAVGINGKIYNIKCIDDTNSCWVETTASEEIDGDTDAFELYEDEVVTLQSDGANWRIV